MARDGPLLKGGHILCALCGPIATDVRDWHTFVVQDARYQQEPMAINRVLLTAHRHDSEAPRSVEQPLQSGGELRGLGHPSVQRMTIRVVELVTVRTSAKFCAEKDVLDAVLGEAKLEFSSVELRIEPRERGRSDICDNVDPVLLQEPDEFRKRLRRMTD